MYPSFDVKFSENALSNGSKERRKNSIQKEEEKIQIKKKKKKNCIALQTLRCFWHFSLTLSILSIFQ